MRENNPYDVCYGEEYWDEEDRYYPPCKVCGENTWHLSLPLGMCPACAIRLPEFELEISFGKSKSKFFKKAVKRWEALAYAHAGHEPEKFYGLRFWNLKEFAMLMKGVDSLLLMVYSWKLLAITLNGKPITSYHVSCIASEVGRVKNGINAEGVEL